MYTVGGLWMPITKHLDKTEGFHSTMEFPHGNLFISEAMWHRWKKSVESLSNSSAQGLTQEWNSKAASNYSLVLLFLPFCPHSMTVYTVSADLCKMIFSLWLCSILAPVPSWEKVLSLAQKTNRRAILALGLGELLIFHFLSSYLYQSQLCCTAMLGLGDLNEGWRAAGGNELFKWWMKKCFTYITEKKRDRTERNGGSFSPSDGICQVQREQVFF